MLLLRVVQATTQEAWIDFARSVSCREFDEEVRHPELADDAEPIDSALEYDDRNREELPAETRRQVMERDRHRCRNCHSYANPHVHHIEHREPGR